MVSTALPVANSAGIFGAYLSGLLVDVFGCAALAWPIVFIAWGAGCISSALSIPWWRWLGFLLLALCLLSLGTAWNLGLGDVRGGGMIGLALHSFGQRVFSPVGATLVWLFMVFIALELSFGIPWLELMRKGWSTAKTKSQERNITWARLRASLPRPSMPKLGQLKALRARQAQLEPLIIDLDEFHVASEAPAMDEENAGSSEHPQAAPQKQEQVAKTVAEQHSPSVHTAQPQAAPLTNALQALRKKKRPTLPQLDLLDSPAKNAAVPPDNAILQGKGARLMECLADFGIQGQLAGITPGPVVSMFEIRPAPGVKVSRIVGLNDDLALALKALAVRIQAPIPGSDTVGVEIPNDTRATVSFRELLQDQSFKSSTSPLSMALGKDIGGRPFSTDLTRMPHLLVAGATGAGKSVCLNSILLSFLYKATPDEVKFLLIDPKRIELAVYADLPHLVHPVVTEMTMAKTALDWAVHEMEDRYDKLARLGVRNIAGYNQKLAELAAAGSAEHVDLEPMPLLVIVIDELSDLMMTAGKEVETCIVRLAQLARAAGMHLIVATQRPSVDVVTGLIKANFPCRISFQVSSKHDSRTILDTVGAEHLLGKGDMLFKSAGTKLQRLHGAFVSDDEVGRVTHYWKGQQAPKYAVDFSDWGTPAEPVGGKSVQGNLLDAEGDEGLYREIIDFVQEQGRVSISLIQRRFRIGFNKAARFVEQMEQDGIISPGDRQNKARQVNRGE